MGYGHKLPTENARKVGQTEGQGADRRMLCSGSEESSWKKSMLGEKTKEQRRGGGEISGWGKGSVSVSSPVTWE